MRRGRLPGAVRRRCADDRGAGAALVIGVVAAIVVVTATTLPLSLAFVESRALAAAADAAALAAADTASGALAGVPCEAAASLSTLAGTRLESCGIQGAIASVTLSADVLGLRLEARSRAGPPASAEHRHGVGGAPQD